MVTLNLNQRSANNGALVVGLVGTYVPDGRMSMMKYTDLLKQSLADAGVNVVDLSPKLIFPRFLGRLARQLDKLCFMLFALRFRARNCQLVHIIDQGDARYADYAGNKPVVITCHDLYMLQSYLAKVNIVNSTGSIQKTPKASTLLLQKMVQGLFAASGFVCVSATTQHDLKRLYGGVLTKPTRVIYNGFGYPFKRISDQEAKVKTSAYPKLFARPFILHIGQNMERKNRKAVLEVAYLAAQKADIGLVIAGDLLSAEELSMKATQGLGDKLVQIHKPTNEMLEALYNMAHCLVFPSYFEGFGWPIIEAQACGCAVICSNTSSLPEVAGAGAFVFEPDDTQAMCEAVLALLNESTKLRMLELGSANLARFQNTNVTTSLLSLYDECLTQFTRSR